MKNIKYFIILFVLTICSCAPSLTEIWVNEDESGKAEMTFDMGEYATMFASMMDEEGDGEGPKSLWEGENNRTQDTLINFYNMMPDSVKQKLKNPELLKQMEMKASMNAEKEEFLLKMSIAYDSEEEFIELMEELAAMKESQGEANPMMAMTSKEEMNKMFVQSKHDSKNHIVRIPQSDLIEDLKNDPMFEGKIDSLVQALESIPEDADSEDLEILKMMLGSKSKTVVHLPNDVQFTNDPNAKIEGRTVTFTVDPIELLRNNSGVKTKEWLIKYK